MAENNEKINQLLIKFDALVKKQDSFSNDIDNLRQELNNLIISNQEQEIDAITSDESIQRIIPETISQKEATTSNLYEAPNQKTTEQNDSLTKTTNNTKSDIEKFIGENIINKIGIAITVIGVSIGAKYSIDNNLITPLTRIILGYLFGLSLLGFSIKLKNKYENYSAVLLSGAMAIMYFITYVAYGFYNLFPQIVAFIAMLMFTIFTVIAAIKYNKQIIAHISLVGAYAIPFLLSKGSDNVTILFSYMTILNLGILAISFKKFWKPLYYVAFGLTWLIFFSWYYPQYQTNLHFEIALIFISIFFTIFYSTIIAYKIVQNERFIFDNIILILINSFVFYGVGYDIIKENPASEHLLGLFTIANAIIHVIISTIIYRQNLEDKNIQYLISGLVIIFLTLAIPVQLDSNWVTLLWAGEAALLFWIGKTKHNSLYEKLSYPLMVLSFLSIIQDWTHFYGSYNPQDPSTRITLFININFLSSILFISAFVFINVLNQKKEFVSTLNTENKLTKFISFVVPSILFLSIYFAIRNEITTYWNQLFYDSELKIKIQNSIKHIWNSDLKNFKNIWTLNFTFFYLSLLALINQTKLKNKKFAIIIIGLILITTLDFLTNGLFILSALRDSFLDKTLSNYYHKETINIWLRYISFILVAITIYASYQNVILDAFKNKTRVYFEIAVHVIILWIASSELINWMDIYNSEQTDKLGLSILWGIYSLILITIGIWKKNKSIRIGAIALFGFTLLKLFFYDLSQLNTIDKTIVFVILGVLLLIISFLYNKYKHLISDEKIGD